MCIRDNCIAAMIAIDKFIQIVRLCGDSIGISISIGIDIGKMCIRDSVKSSCPL